MVLFLAFYEYIIVYVYAVFLLQRIDLNREDASSSQPFVVWSGWLLERFTHWMRTFMQIWVRVLEVQAVEVRCRNLQQRISGFLLWESCWRLVISQIDAICTYLRWDWNDRVFEWFWWWLELYLFEWWRRIFLFEMRDQVQRQVQLCPIVVLRWISRLFLLELGLNLSPSKRLVKIDADFFV